MRIAIFSDVHGNLSGLEAVLADIERQAVDLAVFAGDLCLFGPHPAECARLIFDRRLPSVVGNTDAWLAGTAAPPAGRHEAIIEWTRDQFSPGERTRLGDLPFSLRISPTANAANDLLIVHANPRNVNDIVFPSEADQQGRWGKIRQADDELQPLLGDVGAAVVAYGHLHIPGIRPWGELTLVNVSSVSMPGDEDGRAKYALLAWDGERWSTTHHRVSYSAGAERDAFLRGRPPGWEMAVAALDAEGYYYPQRI